MIRTAIEQSGAGVRRVAQIVCDDCGRSSEAIEIGPASTETSGPLRDLRERSGFVEMGRGQWVGVSAPQGIGEQLIRDICPSCATGTRGAWA